MPIPANDVALAQAVQQAAAHDPSARIRLIAGPGTGKSSSIEQRVSWLLNQGVPPARIYAVSFTRASAKDLKERIQAFCHANGHEDAVAHVRVSTLHSLALRTLRAAGLLGLFPADPLVMDDWELENIFDAEFGVSSQIASKTRREQIRYYHEAFWSTGVHNPPNYLPPNPPISPQESTQFNTFHGPCTQLYSCVLPGELVRKCVVEMQAGNLDPAALLNIEQFIVDEYQDLNPMDQEFVNATVDSGVGVFIAGDDDQSIYSFRFASPAGIQNFPARHPGTTPHSLNECFRCMPQVLASAGSLIAQFAAPNRIPKNLASLYRHCQPPANGQVLRWRFATDSQEATAIAESCSRLIASGLNARDILILLSNKRALAGIAQKLQQEGVDFESGNSSGFLDEHAGRLVLAILRVVSNANDYVAHRTILGLRQGVAARTTHQISQSIIANNANFRDVFYNALPAGVFAGRALTALTAARNDCAQIAAWQPEDTLGQRSAEIAQIVANALGGDAQAFWQNAVVGLPNGMFLRELREYFWQDNAEQKAATLASVYERLEMPVPEEQLLPARVRLMSMHGAKGLSARIVFIPGLEDSLLPGPKRIPYPGLVLEAARLLYVSITRARAVCVLSQAARRFMNGQNRPQIPSRFANHLGGVFAQRQGGLTAQEVQAVTAECAHI